MLRNDMLGSLMGVLPQMKDDELSLVLDFCRKLESIDGFEWKAESKYFLRKYVTWPEGGMITDHILEKVGERNFGPEMPRKFVVKEHFTNLPVDLTDNFRENFKNKTEDFRHDHSSSVTVRRLRRFMIDTDVISSLGKMGKYGACEISIAEIYLILESQLNGGHSLLLSNGWANFFYTYNEMNEPTVVYIYYDTRQRRRWQVGARPFNDQKGINFGRRIFTRE